MPVIVTGEVANGAMAARVMNVSEMSPMSTVSPASAAGPGDGGARRSCVDDRAAHGLEHVEEADVALQAAVAAQPGTWTRPPVRAAAAKKYEAVEASGSTAYVARA